MPKVSIVIPCYNQGQYLNDSLEGYLPGNDIYEIIIVNDGSTAAETITALTTYKEKGYQVIDQKNAGLAAARNTGIAAAKGKYIMLLDADNVVKFDFIEKAIKVFESDAGIAVVYSDAEYFGQKQGNWVVGAFNLQKLMIENYIDACAMVRKDVFEELGGYDTEMKAIKAGWEDWEMWLRISFTGKKFYYWPHTGFKYRVNSDSMIGGIKNSYEIRNRLTDYLHDKYPAQLGHQHITEHVLKRFKPHPVKFLIKLGMIAWFNKKYQQLVSRHKLIKGI